MELRKWYGYIEEFQEQFFCLLKSSFHKFMQKYIYAINDHQWNETPCALLVLKRDKCKIKIDFWVLISWVLQQCQQTSDLLQALEVYLKSSCTFFMYRVKERQKNPEGNGCFIQNESILCPLLLKELGVRQHHKPRIHSKSAFFLYTDI